MVKEMPLKLITDRVQSYYSLSIDRIQELLDELVLLFVLERHINGYMKDSLLV